VRKVLGSEAVIALRRPSKKVQMKKMIAQQLIVYGLVVRTFYNIFATGF